MGVRASRPNAAAGTCPLRCCSAGNAFPAVGRARYEGLVQRLALLALVLGAVVAAADTPSEAHATAQPPAQPAPGPAQVTPPSPPPPFELSGTTITLEVPHAFPRASARERVGFLLDYWNHRFGVKSEWRGDSVYLSGHVFGMQIQARFDVSDSAVTGVAADPGWFWRNKAQAYVTKKLKKYLHPDYADP